MNVALYIEEGKSGNNTIIHRVECLRLEVDPRIKEEYMRRT